MTEIETESEIQAAMGEAKALIGSPLDRSRQIWNKCASVDAVRHFCFGIGDDNPLWLDETYAQESVVGKLTAPGTFLYSVDSSVVFPGLAAWSAFYLGSEWTWFDRVAIGDCFDADVSYTDCRQTTGRNSGTLVLQSGITTYHNQHGQLIAKVVTTFGRREKSTTNQRPYEPRSPKYSDDELDEIRRKTVAETIRGDVPRFWEEVVVGDELGPIIKGPLTLVDMICWYAGNGVHGRRAHRIFQKEIEGANREHWSRSKVTGAFEHKGEGHLDHRVAQDIGMPGPYDNGLQRTAWLGHLLTDWMGDGGFLKKLNSRIVLPNVFGDITWITGKVTERAADDDGDHVVNIDLLGTNQLGEINTTGTAVVRLPLRSSQQVGVGVGVGASS